MLFFLSLLGVFYHLVVVGHVAIKEDESTISLPALQLINISRLLNRHGDNISYGAVNRT